MLGGKELKNANSCFLIHKYLYNLLIYIHLLRLNDLLEYMYNDNYMFQQTTLNLTRKGTHLSLLKSFNFHFKKFFLSLNFDNIHFEREKIFSEGCFTP